MINCSDMLGPIFCSAIRPILVRLDLWHRDIESGWMEVFRLLIEQMHRGYELAASSAAVASGVLEIGRIPTICPSRKTATRSAMRKISSSLWLT